eukprot:1159058-Pelagomonas_calceolata.AAC.1
MHVHHVHHMRLVSHQHFHDGGRYGGSSDALVKFCTDVREQLSKERFVHCALGRLSANARAEQLLKTVFFTVADREPATQGRRCLAFLCPCLQGAHAPRVCAPTRILDISVARALQRCACSSVPHPRPTRRGLLGLAQDAHAHPLILLFGTGISHTHVTSHHRAGLQCVQPPLHACRDDDAEGGADTVALEAALWGLLELLCIGASRSEGYIAEVGDTGQASHFACRKAW